MKIPTDRKILQAIYDRYHTTYAALDSQQVMVPIDCALIGRDVAVGAGTIFGRLYYHLQQKCGYQRPDGTQVALFTPVAGQLHNCVNFPLVI